MGSDDEGDGYATTDDLTLPRTSDSSQECVERRHRRKRKRPATSSTVQVNALVLFLLGGLIFCLADILYIFRYIQSERPISAGTVVTSRFGYTTERKLRPNHMRTLPTLWNESSIRNLVHDALESQRKKKNNPEVVNEAEATNDLPLAADVAALYGSQPRIWGLDTACAAFQHDGTDPASHFITTAGTFNTGTNLMAELLIANCYLPARREKLQQDGVRWQVVWGKHTPVWNETVRLTHRTYNDSFVKAPAMFPVVTIRDPFQWLQSMCRHTYGVQWDHDDERCPNLPPATSNSNNTVTIEYAAFTQQHQSLVHFYNDFYNDYVDAKFPRLIVRMEDLMFHPVAVTQTVCECAGGKLKDENNFHYVVGSAKKGAAHGTHKTSYTDALKKYGTETKRYDRLSPNDLEYANRHLDPNVMEWFGYKYYNGGSSESSQQQAAA